VFQANSAGEYVSQMLHGFLAEQRTLLSSHVLVLMLRMAWLSASIAIYLRQLGRWWLMPLSPSFWAKAISTSTYLINIQPSASLHGGFLSSVSLLTPLIIMHAACLVVFLYVLLAPHENTKLTAQSVECVFLGCSDEHKGYQCRDPVGRRSAFLMMSLLMSTRVIHFLSASSIAIPSIS
jgi:hypothetical protein